MDMDILGMYIKMAFGSQLATLKFTRGKWRKTQ